MMAPSLYVSCCRVRDAMSYKDKQPLVDDKPPTLVQEAFLYLKHHKRWWLVPIIIALALLALVALLSGLAPSLPFIYKVF